MDEIAQDTLRWMRPSVRIEGLLMLWHLSFDGLLTLCEQALGTTEQRTLAAGPPPDRCIVCTHRSATRLGLA